MERATKFGKEQNQRRNAERKPEDIDHENGKRSTEEGIPVEDSPYVNHKDLEDYKFKAYGAEGHQQPESGRRGAGATDAPTPSGAAVPGRSEAAANPAGAIRRQGFS